MAKTIKPSGKMDRTEYLRKKGEVLYGKRREGTTYGISSPSKEKGGDDIGKGENERV